MPQTMTTSALLAGLNDPENKTVWSQFDERYRPVLIAFGQRLGLNPTDAADAAQETLIQFMRDYRAGKFDRNRGRLFPWVLGIAKHRIADIKRARAARREFRGESAIEEIPNDAELTRIWDAECRQALFCEAMRRLAQTSRLGRNTLQAFRLHVLEHRAPAQVAEALGISVRAVYLAKHRCLGRLRAIVADLSLAYDMSDAGFASIG